MSATDGKTIHLKVPYSRRVFSLSGSAPDQSVLGAIDLADGVWEPHVMAVMAKVVKPDDLCLDIGANIGVYTLVLADLAWRGAVHAFEASPINATFLAANVAANDLAHAASHNLGLDREAGTRSFQHFVDFAGCSFTDPSRVGRGMDAVMAAAWGAEWTRIACEVEFETLDAWMAGPGGLPRLDVVKMDVEGSELFVLEGGAKTFERWRPILFVEVNRNSLKEYYGIEPASLFDELALVYSYLYVIDGYPNNDPVRVRNYDDLGRRFTAACWWTDLLCLNEPFEQAIRRRGSDPA